MSIVNLREKTINAKIVYYGTALGGKTTSLKHVHRVIDPEQKVELVSLNTESDRTLFFDFLPITLGVIGGFTVRLQGFTVPGQVMYNLTRKYVLTGADAVVFVADSTAEQLANNEYALDNLQENLTANGMDYRSIPLVLQYNKRDLDDLVAVKDLDQRLNERGVPAFETVATEGRGVFETFMEVSKQMVANIGSQYRVPVDERAIAEALEQHLSRYLKREDAPSSATPEPDAKTVIQPADRSLTLVSAREYVTPKDNKGKPPGTTTKTEDLLKRAVNSNIEIAQLYSEVNEIKNRLHDRVRELTTLNEVGKTLASELNVDRLLHAVLDSASYCLETDHASLLLLDEEASGLVEYAVSGFRADPLAAVVGTGDAAGKLLSLAAKKDGLLVSGEEGGALLEEVRERTPELGSLIVAPLVSREVNLGALVVYFLGEGVCATEEKQRFLSSLASHAAVAMENAQLVRRIESFNRELESTVQQRTSELRKAYEDLRELDRLKDDFLSSMSHELLTPLTSIQSFSEILLSMDDDALGSSLPEFLGIINQESLRLTKRLQQLLDLSSLEAGKITFRDGEVNLRRMVELLLEERTAALQAKSIRVSVGSPPRPVTTVGDEKWIARAVGSLLDNAIEFTGEDGSVHIELSRGEEYAIVSVKDNGIGIAEEFRAVIFQRFKQIGAVLTDKPQGVGLGLPLCREIVERQGGTIRVESRQGHGSCFTIQLPLRRGSPQASNARTPAAAN